MVPVLGSCQKCSAANRSVVTNICHTFSLKKKCIQWLKGFNVTATWIANNLIFSKKKRLTVDCNKKAGSHLFIYFLQKMQCCIVLTSKWTIVQLKGWVFLLKDPKRHPNSFNFKYVLIFWKCSFIVIIYERFFLDIPHFAWHTHGKMSKTGKWQITNTFKSNALQYCTTP